MVPFACRHVDQRVNAPQQFPLAKNPGGPVPVRRPGSVRRTSTIDTGWPDGLGQPMLMIGRARDIRSGGDGAIAQLGEAQLRILATQMREIMEISTVPAHPHTSQLVGVRAGGQSRAVLGDLMADEKTAGTPLYLLLDDFAGASLVSGWIWSQWNTAWMERLAAQGGQDMASHRARMTNICTGFAEGSSALSPDRSRIADQSHCEVVSLRHPDDPQGWHDFFDHDPVSARRARWIDVWHEGAQIAIESGFQDSGINPRGGRTAIHEYRLTAHARTDDLTLIDLDIDPRVLPFPECPGAARKAQAMVGQRLPDFRSAVLGTLPGTLGCTHLNDVLRALAEVPQLAAQL